MNTEKIRVPLLLRVIAVFFSALAAVQAADKPPDYYFPNPNMSTNGVVRAVKFYEGRLYVGGNFTKVTDEKGTYNRTDVAAFDVASGRVTDFVANTNTGTVRAITAGAGKIYVGGTFTRINNVSRSKVAALDPVSGEVVAGFRESPSAINGAVWALALSDNYLYIGGAFTSVDSCARNDLASVDKDCGALNLLFDPSPVDSMYDSGKTDVGVLALRIHPKNPQIVFAAGNFLTIAGSSESPCLAALRSDGAIARGFDRKMASTVKALDVDDSTLYVGACGYNNRIIAFDLRKDPYERKWRSTRAQGDAQAVAVSKQGLVYFGFHDGFFDSTDDYRLAAIERAYGEVWEAYPPMNSFFGVWAIDAADSFLAVGGEFTRMNDLSQKYLALFKVPPVGTVRPAVPVQISPADGEIVDSDYPTLMWNFAARAVSYDVQVAADSLFAGLILDAPGFLDLYRRSGKLRSAASYWWRVRASNTAGKSPWSFVWKFSTMPDDADIPRLLDPADGADSLPLDVVLRWRSCASALSYTVQVSDAPDFSNVMLGRSGGADTIISVAGLANRTSYYWRVNAFTVGGNTDWGNAGFRTNIAAPKIPRCVYPGNKAKLVPLQAALRWTQSKSAVCYRVQVSKDSSFAARLFDSLIVTDTSVLLTGLTLDTRYFWRVAAGNPGGDVCSPASQFSTVYPLPFSPRQMLPAHGYVAHTDSLRFAWSQAGPHVVRYCIEMASDSSMADPIVDSTVIDTQVVKFRLDDKAQYWWRIRAFNEEGWSLYSGKRLFKTAFRAIPRQRFSLDRFSFFRNGGVVAYSLASRCDVRVRLFDIRGKTVWMVARESVGPGSHNEVIPALSFPVGAYFLSLKAGGLSATSDATLVR